LVYWAKLVKNQGQMKKTALICYIGLGSNLNNDEKQVHSAIKALQARPSLEVTAISSLYPAKLVGYVNQPNFINTVVKLKTKLTAHSLLRILLNIEQQYHRQRTIKNGPRALDLDLLLYDNRTIVTKELIVPHPRMWERNFVLIPLQEIGYCK
jgi:2-amino-4-hydroxy-6-hydroxymethyldihydropteridine diphosphokinase